jgi:alanine-synthesizing transaminase
VFSDRVPWPERENRLTQALRRRREAGDPVIDLTETNPTRVGLVYPAAAIAQAMSDPAAARYAPDPRGLVTAREVVSAWLRARGREVEAKA